jgi:hypothetical protein
LDRFQPDAPFPAVCLRLTAPGAADPAQGDVAYSFGETTYYCDQFYDPYRNYPAPIFAIPGNHDGMVAPYSSAQTLAAFIQNFCAAGQPPHKTPESGQLVRTAQIQPGVYFTLEAPFVRILGLYSNCLEDPGVISNQGGTYSLPSLSNGKDQTVFENYDDTEFGYLRVIVDSKQLRFEYHPASDSEAAKTPDDFVMVDLATHKMVHYQPVG